MRSRTDSPCPRTAEVEILGVAFCGPCARQQELYFAIGELTQREEGAPEDVAVRGRSRVGTIGTTRRTGLSFYHSMSGVGLPRRRQ